MADVSKAVLITGCSTGIGRASALRLARAGWTVYASARQVGAIADLEDAGCKLLQLDVTDGASIANAVEAVEAAEGAVGALVNNAGYGLHGAVETTEMDEVRTQFETNFFGLVDLTQRVLPGMREQGWGRIVNISSMGGKFTFPGGAFYHASKHAVEAMSDALRFEVAPFGVDVVVVEPGLIKTRFGDAAISTVDKTEIDEGPYGFFNQSVMMKMDGAYNNGKLSNTAASPEAVARVVQRAISARRPRTRYVVTIGARILIATRRVLPDRAWDSLLRRQYPSPGDTRFSRRF